MASKTVLDIVRTLPGEVEIKIWGNCNRNHYYAGAEVWFWYSEWPGYSEYWDLGEPPPWIWCSWENPTEDFNQFYIRDITKIEVIK